MFAILSDVMHVATRQIPKTNQKTRYWGAPEYWREPEGQAGQKARRND